MGVSALWVTWTFRRWSSGFTSKHTFCPWVLESSFASYLNDSALSICIWGFRIFAAKTTHSMKAVYKVLYTVWADTMFLNIASIYTYRYIYSYMYTYACTHIHVHIHIYTYILPEAHLLLWGCISGCISHCLIAFIFLSSPSSLKSLPWQWKASYLSGVPWSPAMVMCSCSKTPGQTPRITVLQPASEDAYIKTCAEILCEVDLVKKYGF